MDSLDFIEPKLGDFKEIVSRQAGHALASTVEKEEN
jgi:hypothetical protein